MNTKNPLDQLSNHELQILLTLSSTLNRSANFSRAASDLLLALSEAYGLALCELWAVNEAQQELSCSARFISEKSADALLPDTLIDHMPIHMGLPGLITKNQAPFWLTNIQKNPSSHLTAPQLHALDIHDCFGEPIGFQGHVFGILLLYGTNIPDPSQSFLIILNEIGLQIGAFIKHRRIESELLLLAQRDSLTQLATLPQFKQRIQVAIHQALDTPYRIALLYLDIDFFKKINDSLGHVAGDTLLRQFARRLEHAIRETDAVARLGGDEFGILLTNIETYAALPSLLDALRETLAKPYTINGSQYKVTTSIGVSVFPNDANNADTLIQNADEAMYFAKTHGRNQIQISSLRISQLERKQQDKLTRLSNAIETNQLIITLNPILRINNKHSDGNTVHVHWKGSNTALSESGAQHSLQEQQTFAQLDAWVLNLLLTEPDASEVLLANITETLYIPVSNLTPFLVDQIGKYCALQTSHSIALQFDEQLLLDTQRNLLLIHQLKEMGVQIALQHYGTGVSSINLLRNFSIDTLKLDSFFIKNITNDSNCLKVIEATLCMANSLKLNTVACGVTSYKQLQCLKKLGCNAFEGPLTHRYIT